MTSKIALEIEIIDAETGTHTTEATAVLETRIDGRPGCWGIVTDHAAGDLPAHLRLVFVDGSEVTVLVTGSVASSIDFSSAVMYSMAYLSSSATYPTTQGGGHRQFWSGARQAR